MVNRQRLQVSTFLRHLSDTRVQRRRLNFVCHVQLTKCFVYVVLASMKLAFYGKCEVAAFALCADVWQRLSGVLVYTAEIAAVMK